MNIFILKILEGLKACDCEYSKFQIIFQDEKFTLVGNF